MELLSLLFYGMADIAAIAKCFSKFRQNDLFDGKIVKDVSASS